ncbi:MAG: hypothetical protein A2018_00205 [Alphaproteobacteria bacterium GWF2_58_20]|nr:MAG: hypothetical protein A2018_00205 [Alphaproteobacteria bacterium GWF2_58_20]
MTTKDILHLSQLWRPEAMLPIDEKLAEVSQQIGLINDTLYGGEQDDQYNGIHLENSGEKMYLRHQIGEVHQRITHDLKARAEILGFRRYELIKARKDLNDALFLLLEMRRKGIDWARVDLRHGSKPEGMDDGGLEAEASLKNEYDLLEPSPVPGHSDTRH